MCRSERRSSSAREIPGRRERAGVATIGFERALILVLYVAAVLVML
jgi:hypothetical protein